MKKIVAILLMLALSFQCFVKIGIFGYYLANKEYIAKVICINRDKPQLKCDGKCHLKKQLQKEEQEEQKLPAGIQQNEIPLFVNSVTVEVIPKTNPLAIVCYGIHQVWVTDSPARGIFHPPRLA